MARSRLGQKPQEKSLLYHLHTLWLFNRSDLKTVVGPQVAFGVCSALSGPRLTTNTDPTLSQIAARLPQLAFWIWLSLLTETIANQRLPASIVEDSGNKPWRPMPAQRLTAAGARQLLLGIIPVVLLTSFSLGTLQATVALLVFSYMYNELDGANENFVVRNLLNACGLTCFSFGAASIAADYPNHTLNEKAYIWLGTLGAVITSTVHVQDLPDMEGDRSRGRGTIPLVYGEGIARWSGAILIVIWSVLCPAFWTLSTAGYIPSVVIGGTLSARILLWRNVRADQISWRMWCLWMMTLYLLPLF